MVGAAHLDLYPWQGSEQDGYADTFAELMEETEWERYGAESGNRKCANCMVHSGYEASAVNDTFGSLKGFLATVRAVLFGGGYKDAEAEQTLKEEPKLEPLVPLTIGSKSKQQETVEV